MGFGFKVLKLLWHKIIDIGTANKIPPDRAVQKFLNDVEEQYDDKLGFKLKLENLKSETQRIGLMSQFATSFMGVYPNSIIAMQLDRN